MPYVSDRELVEWILPAQFMLSVVLNGAVDLEDPDTRACIALLRQAEVAPLLHLSATKQGSLLRRGERAYIEASAAYSGDGQSVGKFGLVAYYWTRALVDSGYLSWPDDSAFQQAMELLLPCLVPHAEIEAVDRSAQRQAPKLHRTLQRMGLFQRVNIGGPDAGL